MVDKETTTTTTTIYQVVGIQIPTAQWGLAYRAFEIRTHLNTQCFEIRIWNGLCGANHSKMETVHRIQNGHHSHSKSKTITIQKQKTI